MLRFLTEVRVYDVKTGRIVATHVGKGSKADLSKNFAGKLALEALGREAALTVALDLARKGGAKEPPIPPQVTGVVAAAGSAFNSP